VHCSALKTRAATVGASDLFLEGEKILKIVLKCILVICVGFVSVMPALAAKNNGVDARPASVEGNLVTYNVLQATLTDDEQSEPAAETEVEVVKATPPLGPPKVINKVITERKIVCLTFDDAGSPAHVRNLMDVLDQHDVKATFFVLGTFAANKPEVMREMLERGHEVANHSYNHKNYAKMSATDIAKDMKQADDAFKRATGQSFVPYLRPPYGAYNQNTLTAMRQMGYSRLVMWSVDTLDWKVKTSGEMMGHVKSQTGQGGIILMHLLDNKPTLSALPGMIAWLKQNGYEIVTLTEMIALENS
jgi:peptidoglycan/xylan/chitin deacetylase (PgdA/CDA1 family)